jgi:hypothetical protein
MKTNYTHSANKIIRVRLENSGFGEMIEQVTISYR